MQISGAGLQVVAADLPVTHAALKPASSSTEGWLQSAVAQMLVEFMAAFSRKDYEQRRERQAEGIAEAKKAGRLKPRQPDLDLYAKIIETRKTLSVRKTAALLKTSPSTVTRAQVWGREALNAEGSTQP